MKSDKRLQDAARKRAEMADQYNKRREKVNIDRLREKEKALASYRKRRAELGMPDSESKKQKVEKPLKPKKVKTVVDGSPEKLVGELDPELMDEEQEELF